MRIALMLEFGPTALCGHWVLRCGGTPVVGWRWFVLSMPYAVPSDNIENNSVVVCSCCNWSSAIMYITRDMLLRHSVIEMYFAGYGSRETFMRFNKAQGRKQPIRQAPHVTLVLKSIPYLAAI